MNNKKRICITGLSAAVILAGSVFPGTDSFAGQMGGFDVEVGGGSYTWSEEQWGSEYNQQGNNEYWEYQQWNNTGENMQQDWNGTEENTQQNWDGSGENMQQDWNGTGESVQQNWNSAEGNTQKNWNSAEGNSQQNWNCAGENTQQNWNSTEGNMQQDWNSAGGNVQQNWNSIEGNAGRNPSGNMNQNGNQEYWGDAGQVYANLTATPTPKVTLTPVPTPKPTPKLTITPKPSQTPKPLPLISQTTDSNTIKSHFFEHFLFEQSTHQKTQHLPDVPVDFLHQEQTQEGDYPYITFCSEGSVQILSFRINDREVSWHWKENSIIADTPIGKGEYQIELLVLTQGGKTAYMEPWKFSA